MANFVNIYNSTSVTPPFSGIACDVYGNNCSYVGSGSTFPITFNLPSQFNTAPAVGMYIIGSDGCEKFEIIDCNSSGCIKPISGLTEYLFVSQYQCTPNPVVYLTGNSTQVCLEMTGFTISCSYGGILTEVESIQVGSRCYPPSPLYGCNCLISDGTYILNDPMYTPTPPYTAVTVNSCVITAIDIC